MTHDPRRSMAPEPVDDEAIGQLVREAADGWTMPAVRLDAPSWRDRVRGPRARRVDAARGWFGRLGQAATAAVALTVVAALLAVVITRPPQPGSSPVPSSGQTSGQTPGPTAAAEASGLPKLILDGDVPDPSKIVVRTEQGDFAQVDLEKGSIGPALTGARYGSELRVMADGTMVCLCLSESLMVGESPTVASMAFNRYAADGTLTASTPIETFTGVPDPRDEGKFVPERPPHVLTSSSFSADGRYGLVGWSLRAHPMWRSGILVVDLENGTVVSRLALPDQGTGDGDARRVIDAPAVVGVAPLLRLAIAQTAFGWHPVTSSNATYEFASGLFAASFKGGQLTGAARIAGTDDCGEVVTRAGVSPDGGTWLACSTGGSYSTVVRRLAPDGSLLGDTRVMGRSGIEGDMTALSLDGSKLFVWNPVAATLTRVDLATGEAATGQAPIPAAAARGPLAAFGQWLAPVASAKSFLHGGVVLSPDGSSVYAIGVRSEATGPEAGGSTGVFAFDANSLANIAYCPPTADFVSLAVSGDGNYLYAAGLPGVDAAGRGNSRFSASITVFDTEACSIRLIAGLLGGETLLFGSPILD
ncbi:MAG: hypothetical protein ABIZ52_05395 [Candidatus Limnocylindrales bacterium]